MMEIDKLAWIYIKDKKILSTRSKGKDKFYIPGGKREVGEDDLQALIREIKEELTVDLIPDSIEYLGTFKAQAHGHKEGVLVKMTCYQGQYNGELNPDSEIEEVVWLQYRDKERSSIVDQQIFDWLKQAGMIE